MGDDSHGSGSVERGGMIIDIPESFRNQSFFTSGIITHLGDREYWAQAIPEVYKFLPRLMRYVFGIFYILFSVVYGVVKYFLVWHHYVDFLVMIVLFSCSVSIWFSVEDLILENVYFYAACILYIARNMFQMGILGFIMWRAFMKRRKNIIDFSELGDEEMVEFGQEGGSDEVSDGQITEEYIRRIGQRIEKDDVTRDMTENDFEDSLGRDVEHAHV